MVEHPLSKRKVGSSILPGGIVWAARVCNNAYIAASCYRMICELSIRSLSLYERALTCILHFLSPSPMSCLDHVRCQLVCRIDCLVWFNSNVDMQEVVRMFPLKVAASVLCGLRWKHVDCEQAGLVLVSTCASAFV